MGNRYHQRDINLTIAEIGAEIQRIHDSITAPYAPTASMYKTQRKKGTATINNIVAAGYRLTAEGWANFVSDHTGLQIEPQEIVNARRNDSIRKKSKASWADRNKPQRCMCGFSIIGNDSILAHRKSCVKLRAAIYREIIRIQGDMGRIPTVRDWQRLADKSLPSMTWMVRHWGPWSKVVADLERAETRRTLVAAAKKEIIRISNKLATSYAPTKNMYIEQKQKGAPTAKALLKEFSLSQSREGWNEFVKRYTHMEVETPAARAARKERLDTCDTVAPVKIIDETGMAMQADGMPVYKVIERPHETVYMLR